MVAETETTDGTAGDVRPEGTQWYVIHTYSGYENKVKQYLEQRIVSMDVADKVFRVVVPTEEEVVVKNGMRHTVQRKVYPGYVLVEMVIDPQSWEVVRRTQGVTSFVGTSSNDATPSCRKRKYKRFFGKWSRKSPRSGLRSIAVIGSRSSMGRSVRSSVSLMK